MENLDDTPGRFRVELFLSLLLLILVAALCIGFQHSMIKEMSSPRERLRTVPTVIIEGQQMTASEKLAFDQDSIRLDFDDTTGNSTAWDNQGE